MSVRSCPSRITFPRVGVSRPARRPRSVVFPLPEGPTIATKPPWGIVNETLRRTAISRSPLLYSRVTSCAMSIDIRWVALLAALGCSEAEKSNVAERAAVSPQSTQKAAIPAEDSADSVDSAVTVLFFGTSLTAGYGLDAGLDFPTMIAKKSLATGNPIVAVNAGLSGETSAGAVRRIDWALRKPVDVVVVETGGNDALR